MSAAPDWSGRWPASTSRLAPTWCSRLHSAVASSCWKSTGTAAASGSSTASRPSMPAARPRLTVLVAGSVGPTGEFIEPLGEVSQVEMLDAFVEQITALEEGGADAVVIETMFALDETKLAVRAARENTSLTVIATMTFDKGPPRLLHDDGSDPRRGRAGASRHGRRRRRGRTAGTASRTCWSLRG